MSDPMHACMFACTTRSLYLSLALQVGRDVGLGEH